MSILQSMKNNAGKLTAIVGMTLASMQGMATTDVMARLDDNKQDKAIYGQEAIDKVMHNLDYMAEQIKSIPGVEVQKDSDETSYIVRPETLAKNNMKPYVPLTIDEQIVFDVSAMYIDRGIPGPSPEDEIEIAVEKFQQYFNDEGRVSNRISLGKGISILSMGGTTPKEIYCDAGLNNGLSDQQMTKFNKILASFALTDQGNKPVYQHLEQR